VFNYGLHHNLFTILFFLLAGHAWADFAGQGEFMSQAKNPTNPLGQNGVWKWALFHHSMIHAGLVTFFTHSLLLGVFEGILHAIIDYLKCRNVLTFNQDQTLHVCLKVLWAILTAAGLA
jgi:hypothetical protein